MTPRTILVGVGDSYMAGFRTSAPSTMSMTRRCADMLGLECRNYAVSGSGMLGGSGDRFGKQLDTAAADLKDSLDRVAVVLIGGGRNDGGVSGQSSYQETVRATLQHAVDLFPGAKVVFVPAMWDSSWPSIDLRHVYDRSMRAAVQVPQVQTVRGAWSWGIADPGYVDIHPGDALADTFGRLMASAILHGGDTMWRDRELHLTAGADNVTNYMGTAVLTGGMLHARIRAQRPRLNGANLLFTLDNASKLGIWTTFMGMTDDCIVWQGQFDGRTFIRVGDIFGVSNDNRIYNAQFSYNPLITV
ncbi:SGNH/GDSL hydrolase family protein [Bifidobacterium sp. M0353]|uniref:SGNH/GDSL hydrolase family protein n=1 Tax=Bifidobacterium sp. M0353 TaxID=2751006 RepID=UPI0018DD19FD|nr:SGNH/GDSL hydrolase family protein [Bifidobacterium sp. M0353]